MSQLHTPHPHVTDARTAAVSRGRGLAVVLAATLLVVVGSVTGLHAFNPQPEPPARWTVGLVEGQVARLTVVNLAPGRRAAEHACEVRWEWTDAGGRVLADHIGSVAAGTFASRDFHPPDPIMPRDAAGRLQVRAASIPAGGACNLATTLEIFDRDSGRTTAVVGNRLHR